MPDAGPGDRPRLARPPAARYGDSDAGEPGAAAGAGRSALPGPLGRALAVAAVGSAVLVVVGAILASTAGLLFASGATGAAVGLTLARAAAPDRGGRPVGRRAVAQLAMGMALVAVAVAAVATWLVAVAEGGTLGLIDYLVTTFGLFIPGEAVLAVVAAAWGAGAGPVQR